MTLAELSLKRPVTAIMAFVSFVVLGVFSARFLQLEFQPAIDVPFVLVNVPYPGASPKEVERDIVRPIEAQLSTIGGIKTMQSTADENGASIFLLFDWSENVKVKASEVRERIDAARAELPVDVQRILVQKFSTDDQAALTIRLSSDQMDVSKAYDLLDRKLKRPLERIPGVANVRLAGVEPNEVEVALLPERIAAYSIDVNNLAQQLRSVNFSVTAGLIHDADKRFLVQPVGEMKSIDEIGALVLNDAGIRLRDVADIRLKQGQKTEIRFLDGQYAAGVDVQRERTANLVDVCARVMQEINRITASGDLKGIKLIVVEDQGEGVKRSLAELVKSGWEGAFFSLLVLYFFLRHWPSTLMVSLAVPICLTMTLGAMWFLGMTLNIYTMMGLLLGVGMLVDNAVVVVESIYQQREKMPDNPEQCAIDGTRMVQLAVSAGTMTSIIVFLPIVFGGTTILSIFLYYVSVPLTIALLCSWLVSISIIPMLATRVQPPQGIMRVAIVEGWKLRYESLLRWTMRHRILTAGAMLVLVASAAMPAMFIKYDFLGAAAQRTLRANWDLQGNYTIEQMETSGRQFEAYLRANSARLGIKQIYTYVAVNNGMSTRIELLDESSAPHSPEVVQNLIREGMPKFAIGKPNFNSGGGPGGGGSSGNSNKIELQLEGDSSVVLGSLSQDVVRFLQARLPALKDVKSELGNDQQEIRIDIDRERAASLGFSAQQIASTVQVAMRGAPMREFRTDEGEVPMWLRFKDSEQISLDTLKQVRLTRPDGTSVPLDNLVRITTSPGPVAISRINSRTSITISALKVEGDSIGELSKQITEVIKEFPFPPGYGLGFGQSFFEDKLIAQEMVFFLFLAIVFIYMLMAALFESYLYPMSILISVVFSIVGVFWTFWITGTTFSIMAFIGIMILMGVVVNNGIILVEHVNTLRAQGLSRAEALVMGGKERLRPILITTCTTVLGLLPLCFGTVGLGGDGPPYFPMARAIAGGLVFSTLVSLVVLPTMYAIVDDFAHWWRRLKLRSVQTA